jgi:predicted aspartyl protease
MKAFLAAAGSVCMLLGSIVEAAELDTRVPMRHGSAATFYVAGHLGGVGETEFMVDTGSGYVTINEVTLEALKSSDRASYSRDLRGILADGRELIVPVYVIRSLTIGESCRLRNVEAAVFPGATRQILGLSALKKAAPFTFSIDPPHLTLSNCPGAPALADATETLAPVVAGEGAR